MVRTDQPRARRLGRRTLGALVPATLVAALGVAAALTLTEIPAASVAEATGPIEPAAAPRPNAPAALPRTLVPPPPLPDRVVPPFPLPVPAGEEPEPERATVYTCDPTGDPEFGDPGNPNVITNKDCPEINAAKERANREFAEQLDGEVVGDHRERTCSDPTSAEYGTAACGADADGDGLMDGGPLDTN
ncbi:hypothetical protein H7X46_11070 [Pseudonocardia sp. C8]|uniref:hypothetical protein n=1 Tax=Pseudonocardia sp. C8 TaxID=2762759 RepID=UPI001642B5D8|nr:hypothetical protein [Pseudonocardia sp. C8]MBC3191604.1 hypothetical protein [Pseudonocardia sp. C8]